MNDYDDDWWNKIMFLYRSKSLAGLTRLCVRFFAKKLFQKSLQIFARLDLSLLAISFSQSVRSAFWREQLYCCTHFVKIVREGVGWWLLLLLDGPVDSGWTRWGTCCSGCPQVLSCCSRLTPITFETDGRLPLNFYIPASARLQTIFTRARRQQHQQRATGDSQQERQRLLRRIGVGRSVAWTVFRRAKRRRRRRRNKFRFNNRCSCVAPHAEQRVDEVLPVVGCVVVIPPKQSRRENSSRALAIKRHTNTHRENERVKCNTRGMEWISLSLSDFLSPSRTEVSILPCLQCDQMVRLFFNIWPFATMKICPLMSQICQSFAK